MTLPVPPVPDLARAKGETRDELVLWFRKYFETTGAPFNYVSGTRSIKTGYKGLHALPQLMAGCDRERTAQGKKSNKEIVELAAPLSFGRQTRVFDLPRRQFAFGRDFHSPYRIPFFFVEDRVVKLYFLQPRKSCGLNFDELGMVATIYKNYLLDTEFFSQAADVEFVDLSAMTGTTVRAVRNYALNDLALWSEARLADRLTVIAEALDYLNTHDLVKARKRRHVQPSSDMPTFF